MRYARFLFLLWMMLLSVACGSGVIRETISSEPDSIVVPPQDARIDPVWHAIPALDGKMKDTVESMRQRRDVYRPIVPRVTLAHLQPAPIYKGHPDKKMVALMINVAWHEERLPSMLQLLEQHRVRATFFVLGSWLKEHPLWAKRLQDAGHEIGNHAYSHRSLSRLSAIEQKQELRKTDELLRSLNVAPSPWFAPPSGDYNATTVRIAWECRLYTVLWSIDTIDWREPSTEQLLARVQPQIHPGALILMHPTQVAQEALPRLIMMVRQAHLKLGTVSEVLSSAREDGSYESLIEPMEY